MSSFLVQVAVLRSIAAKRANRSKSITPEQKELARYFGTLTRQKLLELAENVGEGAGKSVAKLTQHAANSNLPGVADFVQAVESAEENGSSADPALDTLLDTSLDNNRGVAGALGTMAGQMIQSVQETVGEETGKTLAKLMPDDETTSSSMHTQASMLISKISILECGDPLDRITKTQLKKRRAPESITEIAGLVFSDAILEILLIRPATHQDATAVDQSLIPSALSFAPMFKPLTDRIQAGSIRLTQLEYDGELEELGKPEWTDRADIDQQYTASTQKLLNLVVSDTMRELIIITKSA